MDGMKINLSLRIIFAGVLLVLVNACATAPQSGSISLVGTWTNSLGTVWTIKADGTFDVDRNNDGKRDIWGTYTVAGDTITIQETGPKIQSRKTAKVPAFISLAGPTQAL